MAEAAKSAKDTPPPKCEIPGLILGSVLEDRAGNRWIVTRIVPQFCWMKDYPTPANQSDIPFGWPVVNSLTLIGHISQLERLAA